MFMCSGGAEAILQCIQGSGSSPNGEQVNGSRRFVDLKVGMVSVPTKA